jgi:lysophospholipase L1-like esterase
VIDLAAELTARDLFTDGVHFTVAGNRRRAERLRQYYQPLL